MKILLISGDHKRHKNFASVIDSKFELVSWIVEKREDSLPKIYRFKNKIDRTNFNYHFKKRDEYEKKYFKYDEKKINRKKLKITKIKKNIKKIKSILKKYKPKILITFGSSIIPYELLKNLPKYSINLHSGLAPYYKGSACNFWPIYFLQPNFVGMTFHYLSNKLDSGKIIHHSIPKLKLNENIHSLACRAQIKAFKDFVKIVDAIKKNNLSGKSLDINGKLFQKKDFKPEHLRIVYNTFKDSIINLFLKKKILTNKPIIVNCND